MGHIYVMSDIHGMGTLFEQMLDKISLTKEDVLYILGDMIDRGPEPAKVLDIVSSCSGIIPLRGNHEDCFAEWYEDEAARRLQRYYYNTYDVLTESEETKEKIPEYVRFMKKLPLYKKVRIGDTCYLLAHASTEDALQLWKRKERFLWDSSMIDRGKGIPGYVSVVGHVPTFILRGYPHEPATIWHSPDGRIIDVDCGAAFPECGGRLGCICLDTGEEFYADSGGLNARRRRRMIKKGKL